MFGYAKIKYISRILSVLLAAVICFESADVSFAMEGTSEADNAKVPEITETPTETVQENAGGSCGASLTWNFSGGTLTITGTGKMDNYKESNLAPWYDFREDIVRLNLPDGLVSIGKLAFYECRNLTAVTIPSSVKEIGDSAFAFCEQIRMLTIGNGVEKIGKAAFSDCYSIVSINLPNTTKSLGAKAFYRCETITTVTVPKSVTKMGVSVFSYCKNLVSATIDANISELPEYTFYGCQKLSSVKLPGSITKVNDYSFDECGSLNTIQYDGENISPEELEEKTGANVSKESSDGPVSGGAYVDNGDGTISTESTTVTEGENSTVSTTVKTDYTAANTEEENGEETSEIIQEDSSVDVSVSVKEDSGWTEAVESTKDVLDEHGTNEDGSENHVDMYLYLEEGTSVDSTFIETIAGKDVTVTIMTADGSVWKLNGKDIDVAALSGEYNLSYVLEPGTPELCEELGVSTCFVLKFLAPAEVNAEVLIRIGPSYGRQNATLFQKNKNKLERLQSVVVDGEGYAHFYLGSVSDKTEYYIAMNLPGAAEEAIVPENMMAENDVLEYTEPIQYEITGRKSSWGMNLGQVMGILGIVMAAVIIFVGGIMFMWNKARLKNGYVPKFDDDEE